MVAICVGVLQAPPNGFVDACTMSVWAPLPMDIAVTVPSASTAELQIPSVPYIKGVTASGADQAAMSWVGECNPQKISNE